MALKTRQKVNFVRGAVQEKFRYKMWTSFWWNLIVWGIITSLFLLLVHAAVGQNGPGVKDDGAPVIRQVAVVTQPQPISDLTVKPKPQSQIGNGGMTIRKFHHRFRAGRYGHWPRSYQWNSSYRRMWIRSATRHTHSRAKSHRLYYKMIHTTTCQSAMYPTLNCHMSFPSVRYNWTHPADRAGMKWTLRVAWCAGVAVTEYYTAGRATKALVAVGGKAMGECLPAFLIP